MTASSTPACVLTVGTFSEPKDRLLTNAEIKRRNAVRTDWPLILRDIRHGVPPHLEWISGNCLGPTAASVGIPYEVCLAAVWFIRF